MDNGHRTGLLSVIVPVYNLESYIDACIDSILKQTYEHLEVVVVDDGSKDSSGAILDGWQQKDSRVRVFHTENRGRANARNLALDNAKGEWIGFVDGDDWIEPDMYQTLIELCLHRGAEVGQCSFMYVFEDKQVSAGDSGAVTLLNKEEAMEELAREKTVRFEVAPKVFKRQAVEGVRFVPGQLFEEIHFTYHSLNRVQRFVSVDRSFYQYRQKRQGNTNSIFPPEKLKILDECDEIVTSMRELNLDKAAEGMEAFTLDFIIRLYVNALDNRAEKWMIRQLKKEYRVRFKRARMNPQVRKLRGALFSFSPGLYNRVSQRLHQRD